MNALILGRRRQGKSTLALALGLVEHGSVIVFDPNAQFRAFPHTSQIADIERVLEEDLDEPVIIFRPHPGMVEDEFTALTLLLWPRSTTTPRWTGYTLIVDECSCIQSPNWLHPGLERLLRQAPESISLIQTTHRLVDTHRLTRALATDVYLFHSTSGKDLAIIEQEFESAELARSVSSLGLYQCAHYTLLKGGTRAFWVWENPEDWHIELNHEQRRHTSNSTGRATAAATATA